MYFKIFKKSYIRYRFFITEASQFHLARLQLHPGKGTKYLSLRTCMTTPAETSGRLLAYQSQLGPASEISI